MGAIDCGDASSATLNDEKEERHEDHSPRDKTVREECSIGYDAVEQKIQLSGKPVKRVGEETPLEHANRPPKRARKAGFDEEMFQETSHYIKDGLRHVNPYYFTFTTHAKGRWVGRQLIQVYEKEFRLETVDYYRRAIETGKITVNGKIVDPSTILKHNDLIKTKIHRHEQPVISKEIEILANDDSTLVINKPSSIPVHPCGRFRHNTVVFILGKDFDLKNLHTIHRIDRLTSGILMFAKNPTIARKMEVLMKSRQVQKIYLCKVEGDFPTEEIVCEEPIAIASHNVGVCRVDACGKPCKTVFKKVSYDGQCSIVKCYPSTGRMHQIRVHLQWLGYPIVNDPIYNHPYAWGPGKGKHGSSNKTEKILQGLAETRKDKRAIFASELGIESPSVNRIPDVPHDIANVNQCSKETSMEMTSPFYDQDCSDCKRPWESLSPDEIVMYLHAWYYKGPDWEYKTELPDWCDEAVTLD